MSARKSSASCTPAEPYGSLSCYNPTVILFPSIKQNIQYSNGAEFKDGSNPSAMLYLQDPNGTQTSIIPLNPNGLSTATESYKIDFSTDIAGQSLPKFCLTLSGREAQVEYTSSSLKPKITFEGCS